MKKCGASIRVERTDAKPIRRRGLPSLIGGIACLMMVQGAAHASLLLHYDFDAGDGANSGTLGAAYDATAIGNPTFLAGAAPDGSTAVSFDGLDDAFNFTKRTLPIGGDFTIAYWVKTGDGATFPDASYPGSAQVPGFADTSNNIWFSVGVDGGVAALHYHKGPWQTVLGNTNVADGVFHHLAFVYTNSTGLLDIYVDGAVDQSVNIGSNVIDDVRMGISQIGTTFGTGSSHYANMVADDFRLYDEALTFGQIGALASVPEPATLALLALGVMGMRRSRRTLRAG